MNELEQGSSKFAELVEQIDRAYGSAPVLLTSRFEQALLYAALIHRNQRRKGTRIPYISHLLIVAGTVLEFDGTEDEVIAALLHDAPEDQGGKRELEQIRARFGERVAGIVEACSDAMTETVAEKPKWLERKKAYHKHLLESNDSSVYLVSAADKLHNARSTAADLRNEGTSVWNRFNATKKQALWNYATLLDIYSRSEDSRVRRIAEELRRTIGELA